MRLTISREGLCDHTGSMRCERCFARVIEGEKEGKCVLEQVDDGLDLLTLTVVDNGKQATYVLTQEQILPILGESWPTILQAIAPYRLPDENFQE